jgi:tRNAThr (cytosine32-N3)-methyltransferase
VKSDEAFKENHEKGVAYSSVWDLANSEGQLPEDLPPNSADVVILIFIFSALHPNQWKQAIDNLKKVLKPGGKILFRDYGRYDLAQVRFKKGRLLDDNFYIRGDGTRVYFFTEEELRQIFCTEGGFNEERIATDRRLLVNRKKQLKMYRNWLQAVFTVDNDAMEI